jgi:hypothetical protein
MYSTVKSLSNTFRPTMKKQQIRDMVVSLMNDLDYDTDTLLTTQKGTKIYWMDKLEEFTTRSRKRDISRNKALRLSRVNRIPLKILNMANGMSDFVWFQELQRIRRVLDNNPRVVRGVKKNRRRRIPLLKQIRAKSPLSPTDTSPLQQARNQSRIQSRTRLFSTELQNVVGANLAPNLFEISLAANNFQTIVDRVIQGGQTLTEDQARRFITSITSGGNKFTMRLTGYGDNRTYFLNSTTSDLVLHILTNGLIIDPELEFGSDTINEFELTQIERIILTRLRTPQRVIPNRSGRFFPHINKTDLDLQRYQIFNQTQAYDVNLIVNREHCLIHSLLMAGVSRALTNEVKLAFEMGSNISKKSLCQIAHIINRPIFLRHIGSDNRVDRQIFKSLENEDSSQIPVELAIIENHFFVYEDTEYSKLFINKYDDLANIEGAKNFCSRNRGVYQEGITKITSLRLVDQFLKDDRFGKLDMVMFQEASSRQDLREHIHLSNIENEQTPILKYKTKSNSRKTFFADCESYVSSAADDSKQHNTNHQLQLLGVVSSTDDDVIIYNVNDYETSEDFCSERQTVLSFMGYVTGWGKHDSLVYFHNWKYDYHLIEKHLNIKSKCVKDGQIYNTVVQHRGRSIEFRDSYKLIPFALSKFQKEFDLPPSFNKKEAICYTYYTKANNGQRIKTETYREMLSIPERTIFDKNMRREPSYNCWDNTFNPMDYYIEYLKMDCLVLKKGVMKFGVMIEEVTREASDDNIGMDIFDCLTISSLTDKFMINAGVYDGVYGIRGNLRRYISKAVYGGRVCVNKKYEKQVIESENADYDGVSLYPSAINRLCRETGLPIGKAKRLSPENFDKWDDFTYSVVTVKISKVNKIQQMPFIAHKNKDSINYTNTPPDEPIIIDSITLQDYINFHEIEYEILDGVYWDEGGNRKMGKLIKKLFDTRLKYKTTNKSLANVIKLMLNSSYGKTIMKRVKTETVIVQTNRSVYNKSRKRTEVQGIDKFNNYMYNNFATIKSYRRINLLVCEVSRICADNSHNRGHIGCAILSTSKRIMNEVFDVANTENLPIFYTDTDSLHCKRNDVSKLEAAYKTRFGKQLNGKQLEQFHTDFNLEGAGKDCEIYAVKSIFLGKKSYFDQLESKDSDGNTITGFHLRMKGITSEGLLHASKDFEDGYLGLYKHLAAGNEMSMILNPFNPITKKEKVLFEFKNGSVRTRKPFARRVKF